MDEDNSEKLTCSSDFFDKILLHHHHLLDNAIDDWEVDQEDFTLENPYPISEAKAPLPNHFNELLHEKRKFLAKIDSLKKDFKIDASKIPKKIKKNANYAVLPQYVVDVSRNRIKDPDMYFPDHCDYNWYYTGGVLDCVKVNNRSYVVTPDKDNNLLFTSRNRNHVLNTFVHAKTGPIYSVKSYSMSNDSFLFTLRHKHKVSVILANFIGSNQPYGTLQLKNKSEIPYCDAKLNKNLSSLCTMKANGHLEIVDVSSGKAIREYHHGFDNSDIFSYGQLNYLDNNTLVFCDRTELIVVDSRFSESTRLRLKNSTCNEICTFLCSNNTVYAATKHHLIKYDLRRERPAGRYCHMLPTEPYLIDCVSLGDTDIICLADQSSKVLMQCRQNKCSLPLILPNITDTFSEMQTKEKVHIYRGLEKRLSSPTIGLKLEKTSRNALKLFSSNTAGDIFKQKISTQHISSNPRKKLSDWIDELPKTQTELMLTGVAEMSDAWFTLSKPLDESKLTRLTSDDKNGIKSVERLYSEDNHFARYLEDIWVEDEIIDEESVQEQDVANKVSTWLWSQHSNAADE